jgi:hypothetical protein
MDKEPNNRTDIDSQGGDLGPQYARDNPFTAHMRLHQSWYRAKVLKVPCGTGPKSSNTTRYGSMLTRADGERGLNFLTPHIFEVAKRRVAIKKGLIDRFRLFCNLLSSQPMCFNLFGPLVDNLELGAQLVQAILPGEAQTVAKVQLEFAPEPARDYLNDQTAFDAFISITRPDGHPGFLGIETKLVETFSAKVYRSPIYQRWTEHPLSPWPPAEQEVPRSGPRLLSLEVNQLWRDHMLAVAMTLAPGSPYGSGQFMLVYHPLDVECVTALNVYQQLLKPEDRSFIAMPLDRLVERWKEVVSTPAEIRWLDQFTLRYLDLQASEAG